MPSIDRSGRIRAELNFTELSTFRLLIGVGCTCAALWAVIATTVGT